MNDLVNVKRRDLESFSLQAILRFPELIDETNIQREAFNDVVNRECYNAVTKIDKNYRASDNSVPLAEVAIIAGLDIQVLANKYRTAFSETNREQAKAWVERLVEIFAGERFEAEMKESFKLSGVEKINSGIEVVERYKSLGVGQSLSTYRDIVVEHCAEFVNRDGGQVGISTGMPALDNLVRGFVGGELTMLVAAGGVGKSTLAAQLLFTIARQPNAAPSLLVSGEMGPLQLAERYIHSESRVPLSGKLSAADVRAVGELAADSRMLYNIYCDTRPSVSPSQVRTSVNKILAEFGSIGIVVIDHLRHLKAGGGEDDFSQASRAVQAAKLLAREIPVPVLMLTHLNRRTDSAEPGLDNIRASGLIGEEADNVIFIWRQDGSPLTNARVAKSRMGRQGKFQMTFDFYTQSYSS